MIAITESISTRITCRVHLLPAPANPRGVLLCPDCLSDLDKASEHVRFLRDATIDGWVQWLATQDDATLDWWRKMEALEPAAFRGKAALAVERGGRGAAVVQAWERKEAALARCDAAEREIATAKEQ